MDQENQQTQDPRHLGRFAHSPLARWLEEKIKEQPWDALASFKVDPTWKSNTHGAGTSSTTKGHTGSAKEGEKCEAQ